MVGGITRSVAPDLLLVRPLVVHAAATLAGTDAFQRLFARAVSDRHRALTDGDATFSFGLPVGPACCSTRFAASRPASPGRYRPI